MIWRQTDIHLPPQRRGFHLITRAVCDGVDDLGVVGVGLLHLLLQHTSASLALNENADPDVRGDLERWFSHQVREREPYYRHTLEGPDDMPAHIKGVLIGAALTLPVRDGRLALGTWQGIYLCEHRDRADARRIVATLTGARA